MLSSNRVVIMLALPAIPLVLLVIVFGVVLPAVWSAKPERREAALKVLRVLVSALKSQ